MALQKKDFIEIEFTGRTADGNLFDSNIKENIEKINPNLPAKPFIYCLGEGMFLQGIDDALIGKEVGKHTIELTPEKAFGQRDPKGVQMIPLKVFKQHNINPVPGVTLNFDNRIGKIVSVSGGRILVDFNNPLAGKDVVYDLEVKRKVEDQKEKIDAFTEFLFKKPLKHEIKDKKLIIEADKTISKFVEMFKDKFKEVFDLELEVKEIAEAVKEEKKE
jgi:FKBP-type peptidyl-prolyl cis-trans isomerase SlyD